MTDDLDIPDFLKVENIKPLSAEQSASVKAWLKKGRRASKEEKSFGTQRPQSWDATCEALQRQMDAEKKAKQDERFRMLKERHDTTT